MPSILTCACVGANLAAVVVPSELGQQRLLTAVVEKIRLLTEADFFCLGFVDGSRRGGDAQGPLRGQALPPHDWRRQTGVG